MLFRDRQIDSMTDFRNRKRRGELTEDKFGDVFLLIDGWLNFRQEFELIEPQVLNLASQGLSYGVHLVVSANRWAEIRPALKDLLGTRFELRLGDPSESEVDRRVHVNVPVGQPGRGLSPDKLHFLVGLPRVDGSSDHTDVAEGVQDAIGEDQRCLAGQARAARCGCCPRRCRTRSCWHWTVSVPAGRFPSASTRTRFRRCTWTSTPSRTSSR